MSQGDGTSATTRILGGGPAPGSPRALLVLDEGGPTSFTLPESGSLSIGRGDEVDLKLADDSISRLHARLHVGRTVQIEDAGSANGTHVGGRTLAAGERADLQPGELFELGALTCVLKGTTVGDRVRALRSHAYFTARLEDEVARAARRPQEFAVARVRIDAGADGAIEEELLAAARPGDVIARYAPAEYEALLIDSDKATAAALVAELAARLRERGRTVRTGLAAFPVDARSPDALLAAARPATPAPAAGGGVAIDDDLVVAEPAMRSLHALVDRIARGELNVLLLGETGVGKEVFARRLHAGSARAKKPLLALNCAAFTETLLESELFGHERGAFTGAGEAKPGLLEAADGGIVFLDELGELPATMQAKLLRVLEDGEVRRVGGLKTRKVDVRFIGATNRDLEAEIAAGRFRADLFFRLNGMSITIPPLRARPAEIQQLAARFAAAAAAAQGLPAPRIDGDVAALLARYHWPGNIRELRNLIERAVLLAGDDELAVEHFPVENMARAAGPVLKRAIADASQGEAPAGLSLTQLEERDRVIEALANALGNQTRAAEALGMSRRWLTTLIDRYGIPRPRR